MKRGDFFAQGKNRTSLCLLPPAPIFYPTTRSLPGIIGVEDGMTRNNLSATSLLVSFPNLEIHRNSEQQFSFVNPVLNTRMTGSVKTLKAVQYFETPKMLGEAIKSSKVTHQILQKLLQNMLVLNMDLLVDPLPISIGKPLTLSNFLRAAPEPGAVAIIGAPTDIATTRDAGARHGPIEVRRAFPRIEASGNILDFEFRRYYKRICEVVDLGNVSVVPGEGVNTYGIRLSRIVELVLNTGTTPIVIGGDHSITAPLMQAYVKKFPSIGVIHFDAHHDMYLNPVGPYEILTHGTSFRFVLKERISYLLQLGLRTLEQPPRSAQATNDSRSRYFAARELQSLDPKSVFSGIPQDIPCYLSFDVDCLSPDVAPETGSPVTGGLTYYQALDLMEYAATHFKIVGADFVEVCRSATAQNNRAAQIVARYIAHLILASCSKKAIRGYLYKY